MGNKSKSARVVDTGKLTIDEYCGNVSTDSDAFSVARVCVSAQHRAVAHAGVRRMDVRARRGSTFQQTDGTTLVARAGATAFLATGTRFRPSFTAGTQYIPICVPSFRPDRCVREDENGGDAAVAARLEQLHSAKQRDDYLYHMCPEAAWLHAKTNNEAYYPSTFAQDGNYTHATEQPGRLIETANHFYQDDDSPWVCLRITREALRKNGIVVKDEEAMPVGDKAVSGAWIEKEWVCPHIIGGIPPRVVDKVFPIIRAGRRFVAIKDLVGEASTHSGKPLSNDDGPLASNATKRIVPQQERDDVSV